MTKERRIWMDVSDPSICGVFGKLWNDLFCGQEVVRMKKRLILLLFTFVCSLAACRSDPLKHTYTAASPSSESTKEDERQSKPPIDNRTPVEPSEEAIDIHFVVEKYLLNSQNVHLSDIAAGIGIDTLRETEAGALYSVHPVKQGGRLFIFYVNEENNSLMQWFYVNKSVSYKDFEMIQEGVSIDDVKRVDPAAQIFENIYNANEDWQKDGYAMSWHYLSDGILELGYKMENNKLIVLSKQFSGDFEVHRYNADKSPIYDGHILPIDRIDS